MDQHRDALAANEQQEARPDWHANRAQLQQNLDRLHKMMDRLHAMQPEYLELIECARLNIQNATAFEKELNSFAMRIGFLPMPGRSIEWGAVQRRRRSTPTLGPVS